MAPEDHLYFKMNTYQKLISMSTLFNFLHRNPLKCIFWLFLDRICHLWKCQHHRSIIRKYTLLFFFQISHVFDTINKVRLYITWSSKLPYGWYWNQSTSGPPRGDLCNKIDERYMIFSLLKNSLHVRFQMVKFLNSWIWWTSAHAIMNVDLCEI